MKKYTDKDIIWREEAIIKPRPYCPNCGSLMIEYKEYIPYICDCGKWYMDFGNDLIILHCK